jgi:hypothetical protein
VTDFHVGDRIETIRATIGARRIENGWHRRTEDFTVPANAQGVVTSLVSANRIRARFQGVPYVLTMDTSDIQHLDEVAAAARAAAAEAAREAERKALEPGEDDILPDDPRIQWLWRKIGKSATARNYCAQYDEICAEFDIPGREREFSVNLKLGELEMRASVQARSHKEAVEKVVAKLPSVEDLRIYDRNTNRWNPYALVS